MNEANSGVEELIRRARIGDRQALGELLEQHRAYLRVIAQRHITGKIAARLDASDVIQQTCLSVFRNFEKFEGEREGEFVAWLRRIHELNIKNVLRDHVYAGKRMLGREQPIVDGVPLAENFPAADQSTASQRAMRGERAVELARTLERLPPDQREAVRLRHLEGWPLVRIADQMGRSESATVGLIKRGMQKLREYLKDNG